jgi:hypothetical protein
VQRGRDGTHELADSHDDQQRAAYGHERSRHRRAADPPADTPEQLGEVQHLHPQGQGHAGREGEDAKPQ